MISIKTGIIVPTLGKRPLFLKQCLNSLRSAGSCYVVIVSPTKDYLLDQHDPHLVDQWVQDPLLGLAAAINEGVRSLPSSVQFFNWLGDDDTLTKGSIDHTSNILENNPDCVCVFGKCQYVNHFGEPIWMNRSGRFAVPLLKFGPQLIPQPGALFRRAAFHDVGELNPNYKFAFDLDLLTRLTKVGQFFYTPHHLSTFRWHSGSLTVSNREQSVSESKIIRKLRLPKPLRPISETWEYPIGKLIFWAGTIITAINRLKN